MLHNVCKTKGVGVIAELHAHEALSKSTHPRKFGYHVTVHRTTVRLHHRYTNVYSGTL